MGLAVLSLLFSALWVTLRLGRCESCDRPFHTVESLLHLVAQEGSCGDCRPAR